MQVGERERTKGKGETETRENLPQWGEINSVWAISISCTNVAFTVFLQNVYTKGQIKSEWIYEIINFPKDEPKYLKDFCPMQAYVL